jgi:hypothetical protein
MLRSRHSESVSDDARQRQTSLVGVIPAKAGIHGRNEDAMDSRLRGNDTQVPDAARGPANWIPVCASRNRDDDCRQGLRREDDCRAGLRWDDDYRAGLRWDDDFRAGLRREDDVSLGPAPVRRTVAPAKAGAQFLGLARQRQTSLVGVIPAKAGIHGRNEDAMDSRLRGNDTQVPDAARGPANWIPFCASRNRDDDGAGISVSFPRRRESSRGSVSFPRRREPSVFAANATGSPLSRG